MPTYFFHIRSGHDLLEDEEGIEYPGLQAAIEAAFLAARSLISAEVEEGVLHLDQSIEIHDAEGARIESVEFIDALRIVPAEERPFKSAWSPP